ncbi:MAG: molecular chaperone TorD family protein [Lachnospiraceae bacterium]|nr:molecular chaperone TorD family protein [Lachnospiraceae bacterium]
MLDKNEFRALTEYRSALYRLLSGLYLMEVDAEQLKTLKSLSFPQVEGDSDADLDLQQGYALLENALSETEENDLDELAAEYAKIFLAAGESSGKAAFPYASVYLDKKHYVGGGMEQKMKRLLLARGRDIDPEAYRIMYDHIGLMLEYMAILCEEQLAAEENLKELIQEQKEFLRDNLQSWVYAFTADVVKYSKGKFYAGLALVTSGLLKKETEFLKETGEKYGVDINCE